MKNDIIVTKDTLIIRQRPAYKASALGKGPNEFRIVSVNAKRGTAQLVVANQTVHVKRHGKGEGAQWTDKHGNVYEGLDNLPASGT